MRIEFNNTWFVVGKSAEDNWKIISLADKKYYWVHASGVPSAHVIIEIDEPLDNEIQYDDRYNREWVKFLGKLNVARQIELIYRLNGEAEGERNLFLSRTKSTDERVSILLQKIKQLNNEIVALQSQSKSVKERMAFAKEEAKSLDELYKDGIISRSRYLELKKQMSELQGSKGEYEANISKVRQAINETELEIANIKTEKMNEVIKELQEVKTKIADLEERVFASSDILQRTIIRAPQDGIVNDLTFHTNGGVIAPAGEILEIIPQDDELIIEAKVSPQDIDVVRVGLKAKVRLSAYKTKAVPMLKGEVIDVSADSFQDQVDGSYYFTARVKINEKEVSRLKGVSLYPGMPAESHIITGSRTFMRYLFDTLFVSMNRAFREE